MSSMPPTRPSMPMSMDDHMHRPLPTSPFDINPRNPRMDPHLHARLDPRMMTAPFEPQFMDAPDYFSAMGIGPFGSRGPPSSLPPGLEPETMMAGHQQLVDDMVRRTNLMVQFVNSQVPPSARYCQIQPKMCLDAKFPPEFCVPKTIEEIRAMDPTSIDRVLRAYGLPTDLRSLRITSQDSATPKTARQAKLCTLFDFLGVTQLSERVRMKRSPPLPY